MIGFFLALGMTVHGVQGSYQILPDDQGGFYALGGDHVRYPCEQMTTFSTAVVCRKPDGTIIGHDEIAYDLSDKPAAMDASPPYMDGDTTSPAEEDEPPNKTTPGKRHSNNLGIQFGYFAAALFCAMLPLFLVYRFCVKSRTRIQSKTVDEGDGVFKITEPDDTKANDLNLV